MNNEMSRGLKIRTHSNARLSISDFSDCFELELRNINTNEATKRHYRKLDSGIDIKEIMKIDAIVYHMHHDIGLNIWDDDKNKLNKDDV